jgi:dTDP-4-amino-4,6-dideoxygalactose transaminase
MTIADIPFNKAFFAGPELRYIEESLRSGHMSGDGPFTRRCHELLERVLNVPKALLTTSCTHALEMAALLLDVKPGDEIIVPSFTFVSTVNAFVLRGARPIFADVRADTLNLDESRIETLINERTRAVVCVHYGGVACEMDAIGDVAARHELPVVEDNAHGLFGRYKGKWLGTFGAMATQSFHETKNFTCGEGGALLINDPSLVDRAEIIREKGTNRSSFFRGQVDKYSWIDLGSSYLPADVLAAYLLAQLEMRERIQSTRERIWDRYAAGLRSWAARVGATLPVVPSHCEQSFYLFYLLMPDLGSRQALIGHLKRRGVLSVFHYLPLHLSRMGLRYGGKAGACPVTEDVSARLIRLPFYNDLTDSDQERVVTAVLDFEP